MKGKFNIILGAILVVVLFSYIAYRIIAQPDVINGQLAIDFTAERLDGEQMSLFDLKGNYVLLDFWASWCGPCRRENPKIVKLYETFNGADFKEAKGFEVVSVAREKRMGAWAKAIKADNLHWEYHFVDLPSKPTLDNGKIADLYGVIEIPALILIDPDGMIIGVNLSVKKMEGLLSKAVK